MHSRHLVWWDGVLDTFITHSVANFHTIYTSAKFRSCENAKGNRLDVFSQVVVFEAWLLSYLRWSCGVNLFPSFFNGGRLNQQG